MYQQNNQAFKPARNLMVGVSTAPQLENTPWWGKNILRGEGDKNILRLGLRPLAHFSCGHERSPCSR